MIISIIVAYHKENKLIGFDNKLPWHISDDLKRFKKLTTGHFVVFGRNTFESLPNFNRFISEGIHPLKNRKIIILSNNKQKYLNRNKCLDLYFVDSLDQAITLAKEQGESELFMAGGSKVYQHAIDRANKIYLTEVHSEIVIASSTISVSSNAEEITNKVFFPEYDLSKWKVTSEEIFEGYTFKTLERIF
ncbi:MAG: dihydrofolate reductase [Oligoflexia bacterium]|nr:dihydrofolate reductase [Oligoflexia bacterium]